MVKRAKDVCYTDTIVTESGVMLVTTVATDMVTMRTVISAGEHHETFGAYDPVVTLND